MEEKKLGHLMLDLETMGKKSNAALVSIGAVAFNLESGETGEEFYNRIDLQSSLMAGLKVHGETIYWWLLQNETARQEVAKGGDSLSSVLKKFSTFMSQFDNGVQIWGNGVRFDVGLLEDAYEVVNIGVPWNFRKERDVRTLVSFNESIKANFPFQGTEHNPIDDCKHQIAYCSAIWNWKNLNK